jgi:hypothetical protein
VTNVTDRQTDCYLCITIIITKILLLGEMEVEAYHGQFWLIIL